ncbi:MAG TPA: bifunctional oligoribonuclease/PAP phosphatase NrnA [Thermoleophilaceae bacterium]|nr:bifunctional oligoribonuclease/PAP phosphatase NrnA [Thermoleophilaceae bacterium]
MSVQEVHAQGFQEAVAELRQGRRFILTTHQNPDGDALGSLLGMHELLRGLGKDSVMFMSADQFPLPHEYRTMPLDEVVSSPPDDVAERIAVFLDCGQIKRMPVDFLAREGVRIVNIDHHHDNTRFGTVNLVMPELSCTAEIVYRLAKALEVEITPTMAEALYIGLITDTGRFMYENTTADAHRMAAELVDGGLVAHEVYRGVFEGVPEQRLLLLGRALSRLQRFDDGALTLTHLTLEDFEETGCDETDSEGVVDHFRAVEGTAVGALVRARLANGAPESRKVSLRATDGRVDVSTIARGFGGGGHRQAAGFFTDLALPELVERLRKEIGAQLEVGAEL